MESVHEGVLHWTRWICSFLIKRSAAPDNRIENQAAAGELQEASASRSPSEHDAATHPSKASGAFYDIGAHEGLFGTTIAELGIPVYAWEANPAFAASLQSSARFRVFSMGLGNSEGGATLYRYSDASFNSLYRRSASDRKDYKLSELESISIAVQTLDAVYTRERLLPPLCMKIDTEGAELMILQGAADTLRQYRPVIILEQSYENTKNAGYTREELREYLAALGYCFFGIERNRSNMLSLDYTDRSIWNIIAVHRRHAILQKALKAYTG